jgi:hypothetical protein
MQPAALQLGRIYGHGGDHDGSEYGDAGFAGSDASRAGLFSGVGSDDSALGSRAVLVPLVVVDKLAVGLYTLNAAEPRRT